MIFLILAMINLFTGMQCLGDALLDNKETINWICGTGSFAVAGYMIHIYIYIYFIEPK
jgi:hypothetical protein